MVMAPKIDDLDEKTSTKSSPLTITRRKAFQRMAGGAVGTGLFYNALKQGVNIASADHGDGSIMDSEPDIFNSDYTQHIATKLDNTNSGYSSGDDMYFHRFVVVGDCACTWSNNYDNKVTNLSRHDVILDNNATAAAIYTTKNDNRVIGYPRAGTKYGDTINAFSTVIEGAASILSNRVSTAVSAATIIDGMVNAMSSFYNDGSNRYEFMWRYSYTPPSDACHQVYFFVDHPAGSNSSFDLDSWNSQSAVNSFWVMLGSHPSVYPMSLMGGSSKPIGDKRPDVTALPAVSDLTAKQRRQYGVREVTPDRFFEEFPYAKDKADPDSKKFLIDKYPVVVLPRSTPRYPTQG